MTRSMWSRRTLGVAAAGALVGSTLVAAPSGAAPSQQGCDKRSNNTYDKLLECVRVEGVLEHLEAFQAIADAHDGTRADQTPGYLASVDYVVDVLEGAGWTAEVVPFTYDAADVRLEQLSPVSASYIAYDAEGTGEGDVTATSSRWTSTSTPRPTGRTTAAARPPTSSASTSRGPTTSP